MATVFPQGGRVQPLAPTIATGVFPNGARVQPLFQLPVPPPPPPVPPTPSGGGGGRTWRPDPLLECIEEDVDVLRRAETLAAAAAVALEDGDEATELAATIGLSLWGMPITEADDD